MFPTQTFSVKIWCYIIFATILLLGAIGAGMMQATQPSGPSYNQQLEEAKAKLETTINLGRKPKP
jgi:hypothetical protein